MIPLDIPKNQNFRAGKSKEAHLWSIMIIDAHLLNGESLNMCTHLLDQEANLFMTCNPLLPKKVLKKSHVL
jgi:hypothetical protein